MPRVEEAHVVVNDGFLPLWVHNDTVPGSIADAFVECLALLPVATVIDPNLVVQVASPLTSGENESLGELF